MRADLSKSRDFAEAFRSEALLGATLVHPNLVQVLDCGRFRGTLITALEFVDGASLARLLHERPLDLRAVTFIAHELAAALEYIHAREGSDGSGVESPCVCARA